MKPEPELPGLALLATVRPDQEEREHKTLDGVSPVGAAQVSAAAARTSMCSHVCLYTASESCPLLISPPESPGPRSRVVRQGTPGVVVSLRRVVEDAPLCNESGGPIEEPCTRLAPQTSVVK
jgi:hypothetical protein